MSETSQEMTMRTMRDVELELESLAKARRRGLPASGRHDVLLAEHVLRWVLEERAILSPSTLMVDPEI